jgi:TonB family protein
MEQSPHSSEGSATPDLSTFHSDEFPRLSPALNWESAFQELRANINDPNVSLDAMLQHIVEAAYVMTSADGAAIAIRQDNLIICQARAGDMAPDLGAKLDTDSGISGLCLRTGEALCCDDTNHDERVDPEVCRGLGLRSVAVVPVGRRPALSGVMEVFSALPNAFSDTQLELLEQLAELVIAAQRRALESAVQGLREKLAKVPAQSRAKGKLIVLVPTLLVLLGWLAFRGRTNSSHLSKAPADLVEPSAASPVTAVSNPVLSKPSPSSAMPSGKPERPQSSGVVMARKTEKIGPIDVIGRKVGAERAANRNPASDAKRTTPLPKQAGVEETPPALAAMSRSDDGLGALLSATTSLPRAAMRLSQGLSGGTIERQVNPTYPPQALAQRIEGRVQLQAVVAEDGSVHDLKVLQGDPLLARAATEAVARWHYRPYRLNGQPIRMSTEITLVFRLP